MAPKGKEKKATGPPEPPSCWQPLNPAKREFVSCIDAEASHCRNGTDAVRGKQALAAGRFRLVFEVSPASSAGFGMIVGVCSQLVVEENGKVAIPPVEYTGPMMPSFVTSSQACAWGFCPSTGQLASVADVTKGLYDGARLGRQLHETPMRAVRAAAGMSIAMEVFVPAYDPADAAIARRTFATGLHPLDMRGRQPGTDDTLEAPRPSLGFRINGGELVDSGVQSLPPAVYPWVSLGCQGDKVTLVSIEKMDEPE